MEQEIANFQSQFYNMIKKVTIFKSILQLWKFKENLDLVMVIFRNVVMENKKLHMAMYGDINNGMITSYGNTSH